ncbi:Alpha/Beta hydrolase protein [Hygrophoropsis aurantiaca]|uniref:Alpha/Beta hydrolase protein n=1 Tax=Hygrophoropsis aurantiaca TaxID=72124 RepID=A0ACB7ZSW1_9AGAM|nr:Alpha/Beta hydrolase protein [Hygrophoropsis aurantiaca]
MSFTEFWLPGPQGTQFYTRTYDPSLSRDRELASTSTPGSKPKAAIVFVHGFIEHIARYEHVFSKWAQRGFLVFAYDQRGFGRTALGDVGAGETKTQAGNTGGKSNDSAYGKTSWAEQIKDIEWAVGHVRREVLHETENNTTPIFLYGHSMGGALVLAYATSLISPASSSPSSSSPLPISGVISTSPLLAQTKPAARAARWIGGKAARMAPWMLIPAEVKAQDLSHDPAVAEAYINDPLVKYFGSLKGISTMLDGGEAVLREGYKCWPVDLPLLIVHGTADKVTSHDASYNFHQKIEAHDKTYSSYTDGFHELHNEPNGVKERLIEESIAWVEARVKVEGGSGSDEKQRSSIGSGVPASKL